jgi:hypothetical protein
MVSPVPDPTSQKSKPWAGGGVKPWSAATRRSRGGAMPLLMVRVYWTSVG